MPELGHLLRQAVLLPTFRDSRSCWERRYRLGGGSGVGSGGRLAAFKAEFLNGFVRDHGIESVIEFGCGDGRQLALADCPLYLGLDVSRTFIARCAAAFADDPGKSFLWHDPDATVGLAHFAQADLGLSVDVICHLVEDGAYETDLRDLFSTARCYVVVYSSDRDGPGPGPHVRHRQFGSEVTRPFPEFWHRQTIPNRYPEECFCSFFVFQRVDAEREGS